MKYFRIFGLIIVVFWGACEKEKVLKSNTFLIEYPMPFYFRNDSVQNEVFYGIETNKFIYVQKFNHPWLLHDKRIITNQPYNYIGLDEYIFIQSDLEKRLNALLKVKIYNREILHFWKYPTIRLEISK